MERNKIDMFMLVNSGKFNDSDFLRIQSEMEKVPEEQASFILGTEFKAPSSLLIISFLGGTLGLDRFFLGQTGKGILKLITCGGFGLWSIIDLFIIMGATKEYNTNKLIDAINSCVRRSQNKAKAPQNQPSAPVAEIADVSLDGNSAASPSKADDHSRFMPSSAPVEPVAQTSAPVSETVERVETVAESASAQIGEMEKLAEEIKSLSQQSEQA